MSSQVENFTPREIFYVLRDRDPKILLSNDDYTSHVRSLVMTKMGKSEGELSVVQYSDLVKDSRSFVSNIRKKWKAAKNKKNKKRR